MTARVGELNRPLFHWAPRDRRPSITRLGLVPGKRPTSLPLDWDSDQQALAPSTWRPDYVCLGPDPWLAACYSWRVHGHPGQTWDLWQVWLDPAVDVIAWRRRQPHQTVHVHRGPDGQVTEIPVERRRLIEVRVANRIPKRRVEWLADRTLRDVRGRPR